MFFFFSLTNKAKDNVLLIAVSLTLILRSELSRFERDKKIRNFIAVIIFNPHTWNPHFAEKNFTRVSAHDSLS